VLVGLGCSSTSVEERLGTKTQAIAAESALILGFEDATDWAVNTGAVSSTSNRTQGNAALAVRAPVNYTSLVSAALDASAVVGIETAGAAISVDLLMPEEQPNPWYFGAVQLYASSPSSGVYNQYLGQVELTGKPLGEFVTYEFQVPDFVRSRLAAGTFTDLTFTLALNAPFGATGTYIFDNLHVVGHELPTGTDPACALLLRMDEPEWTGAPGEVVDSCGGDDNGTVVGAASVTDGQFDGGGLFEGGCIEIADSPALQATTELTYTAWARPSGMDGVSPFGILSKRVDFAVESSFSMFILTQNRLFFDIGQTRYNGSTHLQNGTFYHLAVVFDGNLPIEERVRAYVDGELEVIDPQGEATLPPFTSPLSVGCLGGNPTVPFAGDLDEVTIWTRALSDAEIQALASGPAQP
jgi:hypothetical protein